MLVAWTERQLEPDRQAQESHSKRDRSLDIIVLLTHFGNGGVLKITRENVYLKFVEFEIWFARRRMGTE
jgi:hypothetical protein